MEALTRLVEQDTAGDPMKPEALWTNLSVSAITDRLAELGTPVDRSIVEQLLDEAKLGLELLTEVLT